MTWRLMTGFAFMFILGTMVSAMIEGGGGFGVTTLTANLAENGDTAAVTTTAGFLNTGYIVIQGEESYYSAKTDTTLTLPNNHRAHLAGAKVMTSSSGALNSILGFDVGSTWSEAGAVDTVIQLPGALLHGAWKMTSWDYSYLDNDFGNILRLVLSALSAGFIIAMVLTARQVLLG